VPREGPVVFAANHPYGIVDGVLLGRLMARVRADAVVVAHKTLAAVDGFADKILPVDFAGTKAAERANLATRRRAREHLSAGGALGIFPGGGVATARGGFGPVEELPWGPFTASLILASGATAVPVWFGGANGRAFHVASRFSRTLRLGLLARETRRQRGRKIRIVVNQPLSYADDGRCRREAVTDELRTAVMALATAGRQTGKHDES
ncbi:MAG: 1-acyl-sn-glycerol-3-phosphate acyltransferase, partial [Planctomycetota bacterium]